MQAWIDTFREDGGIGWYELGLRSPLRPMIIARAKEVRKRREKCAEEEKEKAKKCSLAGSKGDTNQGESIAKKIGLESHD